MDESSLEKFIKRESEMMKRDREKNSYLNQEPFRTNRILEENLRLIKEKDFKPGKKIWLTLLK